MSRSVSGATIGSLAASILALSLTVGGCDLLGPDGGHFAEPRFYEHDFFESEEACLEAQQQSGGWFNCSQAVVFCPSGTVELVVTDIQLHGRYVINGRRVTLRFPSNPEVGERYRFSLNAEQHALVDEQFGTTWVRKPGAEKAEAARSCRSRWLPPED